MSHVCQGTIAEDTSDIFATQLSHFPSASINLSINFTSSWVTCFLTKSVTSMSALFSLDRRYSTSSQYSLTASPSSPGSVLAFRKASLPRLSPVSCDHLGFLD